MSESLNRDLSACATAAVRSDEAWSRECGILEANNVVRPIVTSDPATYDTIAFQKTLVLRAAAMRGDEAWARECGFLEASDVVLGRVMDLACVSDPHLNLLLSAFRGSFTLETVVTSTGPFDLLNVKRELGLEGHSMSFLSAECLVPIWEACTEYQEHTQTPKSFSKYPQEPPRSTPGAPQEHPGKPRNTRTRLIRTVLNFFKASKMEPKC